MEEICEYCIWHNHEGYCDHDESDYYGYIVDDNNTCDYCETLESL